MNTALRIIAFFMLFVGSVVSSVALSAALDRVFDVQHGALAYQLVTLLTILVTAPSLIVGSNTLLSK